MYDVKDPALLSHQILWNMCYLSSVGPQRTNLQGHLFQNHPNIATGSVFLSPLPTPTPTPAKIARYLTIIFGQRGIMLIITQNSLIDEKWPLN